MYPSIWPYFTGQELKAQRTVNLIGTHNKKVTNWEVHEVRDKKKENSC